MIRINSKSTEMELIIQGDSYLLLSRAALGTTLPFKKSNYRSSSYLATHDFLYYSYNCKKKKKKTEQYFLIFKALPFNRH